MSQVETARRAHEDVCSGARKSVAVYLALFPDLRFVVDEQLSESDRVVSCLTLTGTHRGRSVRVWRSLRLAVKRRKLLRNA